MCVCVSRCISECIWQTWRRKKSLQLLLLLPQFLHKYCTGNHHCTTASLALLPWIHCVATQSKQRVNGSCKIIQNRNCDELRHIEKAEKPLTAALKLPTPYWHHVHPPYFKPNCCNQCLLLATKHTNRPSVLQSFESSTHKQVIARGRQHCISTASAKTECWILIMHECFVSVFLSSFQCTSTIHIAKRANRAQTRRSPHAPNAHLVHKRATKPIFRNFAKSKSSTKNWRLMKTV